MFPILERVWIDPGQQQIEGEEKGYTEGEGVELQIHFHRNALYIIAFQSPKNTLVLNFTSFCILSVPWGSYFDYVFEWNKHAGDGNIMTITYEELKEVSLMLCGRHCTL